MTNIDKYLIVFVWISTSCWKFVATNIFCSLQMLQNHFVEGIPEVLLKMMWEFVLGIGCRHVHNMD